MYDSRISFIAETVKIWNNTKETSIKFAITMLQNIDALKAYRKVSCLTLWNLLSYIAQNIVFSVSFLLAGSEFLLHDVTNESTLKVLFVYIFQ